MTPVSKDASTRPASSSKFSHETTPIVPREFVTKPFFPAKAQTTPRVIDYHGVKWTIGAERFASVDTGTNYKISTAEQLFDTTTVATTDLWGAYDVLPDGDFIMVEPADWEKEAVRIHVITNWVTELSK